jgi:hypothetical protein
MKIQSIAKITGIALASAILLNACGGGSSTSLVSSPSTIQNEITSVPAAPTSGDLSTAEIEGLLYMREEEELARDLYLDIYAAKDSRLTVFKNISDNAETQHAAAMLVLLEKYGIEDPSTGLHNTYTSEELQALYNQLLNIALGSDDVAALKVGALVEETDIHDINTEKAQVSVNHQDIISTYDNLLCGSRNHLRSFVKQIESRTGQAYVTQVPALDAEVQAILSSSQEQCGI